VSQVTIKAPAHPCLLQCYSQWLSYGNSQDAPLLTNGLRKCGIYIQWNFTRPQRRIKILSFAGKWMELGNIILSEVNQARRPKTTSSLSYAEYRPNANAAICETLVTLRGDHFWEG
jgi:hypothetical protein